jgi:flagella basal body P-ring formation protein FlgA
VEDIFYNARTRSWEATISLKNHKHKPLSPIKLQGRYDEQIRVPVLSSRVRQGQIIDAGDVTYKLFAASRLKDATLLDAEQLVGKTPRRTVAPNRMLQVNELIIPPVVHKGEQITVQYISGVMTIRTVGEALSDGAPGDMIRIRNSRSNQVLNAKVVGPQQAEVLPLGVLTAAHQQLDTAPTNQYGRF